MVRHFKLLTTTDLNRLLSYPHNKAKLVSIFSFQRHLWLGSLTKKFCEWHKNSHRFITSGYQDCEVRRDHKFVADQRGDQGEKWVAVKIYRGTVVISSRRMSQLREDFFLYFSVLRSVITPSQPCTQRVHLCRQFWKNTQSFPPVKIDSKATCFLQRNLTDWYDNRFKRSGFSIVGTHSWHVIIFSIRYIFEDFLVMVLRSINGEKTM